MSIWKSFPYYAETISLVLLLLLHHDPPTCDAITNNQAYCKPSSCGKISNIKHPFRLTDDPTTCGDPSYELSCENNRTVLTVLSGKYYVQEINYINYTIRLVDSGIEESDCSSIPRYFLTTSNFTTFDWFISSSSSSYYYSSGKMDLYVLDDSRYGYGHIIYLKCSKAVKDDPWYVDTAPCINRHSKSYLYAFAPGEYYPEDDFSYSFPVGRLKDYCQVKVVTMSSSGIPNTRVREDVPNRPLSYQQIHGILLYGFQLSWATSPCRDTCGYKKRATSIRPQENLNALCRMIIAIIHYH